MRIRTRPLFKMVPFYILVLLLFGFRAAGHLGVRRFSTFQDAAVPALAITFLFTGATHFTSMTQDYLAMIPPPNPREIWIIHLTGGFEILGAFGLLIHRTRKTAGICLTLLLFAMFPANLYVAFNDIPFRGRPASSLWLRVPAQVIIVTLVLWVSAFPNRPKTKASPY